MPLPLALLVAAGIAGVGGVGAGVHGAVKMKDANDTISAANSRHERNLGKFKEKNEKVSGKMDDLGKAELNLLSSFKDFADLFEKIQNRPEFKAYSKENIKLPEYNGEELKKVSVGAGVLVGGLGGAALGTAGGFAAAGATTAAVMALGTASTGTAIASLSGAAATNATLAALGGGAIAAGGGGIALGTTVLGAATLGVGLLVGGIIFNITGSSLSDKADEAWRQMKKAEEQINVVCDYLDELGAVANGYLTTLNKVDKIYRVKLKALNNIVNVDKKTDWNSFSDAEKKVVENTVLLVQLLYKMCQVKLVIPAKTEGEANRVNKQECEETRMFVTTVMKESGLETEKIQPEAPVEKKEYNEYEKYCLAMTALVFYFAECDGEISPEEHSVICATLDNAMKNGELLGAEVKREIDEIRTNASVDFGRLCKYMDVVHESQLHEFARKMDAVIKASEGITYAEEEARKKFVRYLSQRNPLVGTYN